MLFKPTVYSHPHYHLVFDDCLPEWQDLNDSYPDEELFVPDAGYRSLGQKPHSRLLLRYTGQKFAEPWQKFIDYIRGPEYRSFIRGIVEYDNFELRLAWHRGRTGEDIGPHTDSGKKLTTHLFYFNQNWKEAWDGSLWFLGGLRRDVPNPDFDDFNDQISHRVSGNRSVLFKTPQAWHGVRELACPPGVHRRLFQVCARSTRQAVEME